MAPGGSWAAAEPKAAAEPGAPKEYAAPEAEFAAPEEEYGSAESTTPPEFGLDGYAAPQEYGSAEFGPDGHAAPDGFEAADPAIWTTPEAVLARVLRYPVLLDHCWLGRRRLDRQR